MLIHYLLFNDFIKVLLLLGVIIVHHVGTSLRAVIILPHARCTSHSRSLLALDTTYYILCLNLLALIAFQVFLKFFDV